MVGMAEDFADLRRLARDVLEALEDPDSDLVARIDALGGAIVEYTFRYDDEEEFIPPLLTKKN